ncbi:hypothetical protein ACK2SD_01130 [Pseudomonas sp. SC11]|uniref:hypothetical protein n=1 Tax=Pseudomonas sp. SC11 TaxID=326927 RepID=UPI00399C215F
MLTVLNSATGLLDPYKVCSAFFREHRMLRIHVTDAYFARTGEGSPDTPIKKGAESLQGCQGHAAEAEGPMPQGSTESTTAKKMKSPETANPARSGILSCRFAHITAGQDTVTWHCAI